MKIFLVGATALIGISIAMPKKQQASFPVPQAAALPVRPVVRLAHQDFATPPPVTVVEPEPLVIEPPVRRDPFAAPPVSTPTIPEMGLNPAYGEVLLQGTSFAGDRWMAILNGELVEVGAELPGGWTVLSIDRSSVEIERGQLARTLKLNTTP